MIKLDCVYTLEIRGTFKLRAENNPQNQVNLVFTWCKSPLHQWLKAKELPCLQNYQGVHMQIIFQQYFSEVAVNFIDEVVAKMLNSTLLPLTDFVCQGNGWHSMGREKKIIECTIPFHTQAFLHN